MNYGKIETSPRLAATLQLLRKGFLTTLEIQKETGSMAVHSDIAAIRIWEYRCL